MLNLRDPTISGPIFRYVFQMLKKVAYLLLTTAAIVALTLYIKVLVTVNQITNPVKEEEILGTEKQSVFTDVVKPIYEKPSRLYIKSQNINVDLVEVDVAADGTLEAPKDWFVGGWYADGAKVGEPGNLIIDGHYDTNTGAPAAFWNLKNITSDDIVTIVDDVGRSFDYKVTKVDYIEINDPNRLQIFDEKKDTSHVTLITCGGVWLPSKFTYSKRLVVKGELID